MKKQIMIPLTFLAAALVVSLIALSGCSPDIEGTPNTNIVPWVRWAETPSDSIVHSFNPVLHWYGADQDGQINDYIFGVFQDAYMDSATRENSLVIPDTLTWISLGNVTSTRIPLVASPDSSDTIGQYVVLRAIDDLGDTSTTINRYLYRTNHKPTCLLTVPSTPQWCLPDTTDTWGGVSVTWEGGDSLDYTGAQPDFLWEVRIFGPYPTQPDLNAPDTSSTNFLRYLEDGDEDPLRIDVTSADLVDLRTGWYIIVVRNFDDANVPSDPALGSIEVYEPEWINNPADAKDVLIVDFNNFRSWWGELSTVWRDSVNLFFENLMADVGIDDSKWDWSASQAPPIRVLYEYRMVLITDIDWTLKIGFTSQAAYISYLEAGGSLWVIGRQSFNISANITGRLDYGTGDPLNPLPFDYFGISAAMIPPNENDSLDGFSSEFQGASSIVASLPNVVVDTVKTLATSWQWPGPDTTRRYEFRTLPCVEFLILDNLGSQAVYTYSSIRPDTSRFDGFPVGITYETSTFKTSYFCFHPFFLYYDDALAMAQEMFSWFLDE